MSLESNAPDHSRAWFIASICLLSIVILLFAPLFIAQPLWADASLYDVCAQEILAGRVLYRDIVDVNFPGIVWMHVCVRTMFGWSTEALRIVDLLVVCVIAGLLVSIGAPKAKASLKIASVAATLTYYTACPSICHCQRDIWMMLFSSSALALSVARWRIEGVTSRVAMSALEGLLWGAAVWMKPYIVIVAVCCWLYRTLIDWRSKHSGLAALLFENAALLGGGLIAGALGCTWLWSTESWPHFWDFVLGWSVEYRDHGTTLPIRGIRFLVWTIQSLPWSLVSWISIPIAVLTIHNGTVQRLEINDSSNSIGKPILAIYYLSWLVQALLFQHPHEYVIAIALLPGLGVLTSWMQVSNREFAAYAAVVCFAVAALLTHPLLTQDKRSAWLLCIREGGTPRVKDILDTPRLAFGEAHWQDLASVEQFLRKANTRDDALLCWDDSSHPLFTQLRVSPASRFPHAAAWLRFFPERRSELLAEFENCGATYVVTDLLLAGVSPEVARSEAGRDVAQLPAQLPKQLAAEFPWRERVVFRAGRYLVHEVKGHSADEQPQGGKH